MKSNRIPPAKKILLSGRTLARAARLAFLLNS